MAEWCDAGKRSSITLHIENKGAPNWRPLISLCSFILALFYYLLHPQLVSGQSVASRQPRYLFFLHNKFIELHELTEVHPEYGRAEYTEILDRFRSAGFIVISEKRPKETNVKMYANKVIGQIDSLISKGVPTNNITIAGTSKGGYIAQFISTYARKPELNFVFIGCFQDVDLTELPEIQFCGNILSIYEKTDSFGVSAIGRKQTSKLPIPHFKEIELFTNQKHGFLFHPLDAWVLPTIQWAMCNYVPVNPQRKGKREKVPVKQNASRKK